MRPTVFRISLSAVLLGALAQLGAAPSHLDEVVPPVSVSSKHAVETFGKLPLAFVPNAGQIDARVHYYAQVSGAAFYFTAQEAVFTFSEGVAGHTKGVVLRLGFVGANRAAKIEGMRRGTGEVNYFVGRPSAWRSSLVTYEQIAYRNLWPGIDLIFRGNGGALKYEFHLKPGAHVNDIRLVYRGADRLALGQEGDLLIQSAAGVLRDARPTSYQVIDGREVPIDSDYVLRPNANYGFAVGDRVDPRRPLVIDPGLVYSTFIGGPRDDSGYDIVVDPSGYAYVTGRTVSAKFPTTAGAFDTTRNGPEDIFITKLTSDGSALVYSTFLGGTGSDGGYGIALGPQGHAYVIGFTESADFPVTPGAFDTTFNGGTEAFVTQLNANGSALVYSTFLGGSGGDVGSGITVDSQGCAYVTGLTNSGDFPVTQGAFDNTLGFQDLFVTKISAGGATLIYSTYLGGSANDTPFGNAPSDIAVDGEGHAYLTGLTNSPDFPTTAGAFDRSFDGGADAFVTKLNPGGSALAYSTFLGGTEGEHGDGIAVDLQGQAYVTGSTTSGDFPTTAGAFDRVLDGFNDAFVTKLTSDGSALVYSTLIGGTGSGGGDSSLDIAIGTSGQAYITGETTSADFPTTPDAFDMTLNGLRDAFVTQLSEDGSTLGYSTFIGGTDNDAGLSIALDRQGDSYVAGSTESTEFPVTPVAFDTTFNGRRDVFVTKLDTGTEGFLAVEIDIKPGTARNSINSRSQGKIPVAILSNAEFDAATEVDTNSLTFGRTGDEPSLAFCHPGDANGDQLLDLVCHFKTENTGFVVGDVQGVLKGQTLSGVRIQGTDSVRIVP